jgi:hypothetical protein
VSTCSFDTLTTRCDIFRIIVPALIRGESADEGDSDRFRADNERSIPELTPVSTRRLSPSREPLGLLLGELPTKRTLRPELSPGLGPLLLSCLCPCGVNEAPPDSAACNLDESVNGNVSSSSRVPGEKNAGPSSNCTDTISSILLFVLKLGKDCRLARAGRGGVCSTSSSLSPEGELGSALKLKPANPIAAWNAPRSATGEYAASSSSSGIRSCCPDGEVTNATGESGLKRAVGGLGDRSDRGAYLLLWPE